jgi:threonine dehydrogenase-like Zn-dependent dehydrogenase
MTDFLALCAGFRSFLPILRPHFRAVTGQFGGAAITLALALGARVIAAGRNEYQLKKMVEVLGPSSGGRLSYVKMQGDIEADAEAIRKASPNEKGVDVYIDFSPAVVAAETSNIPHMKSALIALKTFGRVSFMGGIQKDVNIPYSLLMFKSLRLSGRFMYDRKVIPRLVSMLEGGLVKVGPAAGQTVIGPYGLEKMEEAIDVAERNAGWGSLVCLAPCIE